MLGAGAAGAGALVAGVDEVDVLLDSLLPFGDDE